MGIEESGLELVYIQVLDISSYIQVLVGLFYIVFNISGFVISRFFTSGYVIARFVITGLVILGCAISGFCCIPRSPGDVGVGDERPRLRAL